MINLKRLESSTRYLDKTLELIAITSVIISVLLAFIGVVLRYQFGVSYEILGEISTYAVVYGVFAYAGPLIKKGEHIKMDLLHESLRGKAKHYVDFFISLLLLAAFSFLLYAGIGWASSLFAMNAKTLSGGMLLFIPAMAIVMGMFIGIIYSVLEMIRVFYHIRN